MAGLLWNEVVLFSRDTVVSENKRLIPDVYRLSFVCSRIACAARPGQFIHLHCMGARALLRRPFSIYQVKPPRISIVYRVVGAVTRTMATLKRNDPLQIIGPIGHGFSYTPSQTNVLVAGGMGLAALNFLSFRIQPGVLFYGARTKKQLWGLSEFTRRKWKVVIATENGSRGVRGPITKPLEQYIRDCASVASLRLFVCGPLGLARAVADCARTYHVRGQASLENVMACGVGACQGCVIEVQKGPERYKRVCHDGPVFDLEEL
ncbi:MAG: hypothetical protein GF384_09250 [Elusimicrobia bacterium]|nr:hypothetical protein [Elusimicrobiota bacterium]MBD3412768.1 hypothetical protein [Elusimicrobiota bacterium]